MVGTVEDCRNDLEILASTRRGLKLFSKRNRGTLLLSMPRFFPQSLYETELPHLGAMLDGIMPIKLWNPFPVPYIFFF